MNRRKGINAILITAPKTGSHMIGYAMGVGTRPTYHMTSSLQYGKYRTIDQVITVLRKWQSGEGGIWTHLPYSDKLWKYLQERFDAWVFALRDPRDRIVSLGHYMDKHTTNQLNLMYDGKRLSQHTWDDRCKYLIVSSKDELAGYFKWVEIPEIYKIRYEDCVDDRRAEFEKLREYFAGKGIDPPPIEQMVKDSHVQHAMSYRRGKYGDWKKELSSENIKLCKEYLNTAMKVFGYEW